MRFISLLFLAAALAQAQAPVYTSVTVDNISHSSARVRWTLAADSTSNQAYCWYGTSPDNLNFRTETLSLTGDPAALGQGARSNRVCLITGVPANSKVYFRPVTTASNGSSMNISWGCTGADTVSEGSLTGGSCEEAGGPAYFMTTEKGDGMPIPPNPPNPVSPVITNPAEGVNRFTVSSDCSDLVSKLNGAVAAAVARPAEVVIPARTECKNMMLPAKPPTSHPILIRTSEAHLLPPPGVRVTPEYAVRMAKLTAVHYGPVKSTSLPLYTESKCSTLVDNRSHDQGACSNATPDYTTGYYLRGIEIYPKNLRQLTRHLVPVSVTGGGSNQVTLTFSEPHEFLHNDFVTIVGNTRLTPANQLNGSRSISAWLSPTSFRITAGATLTNSGTGTMPTAVMHSGGQVVKTASPKSLQCSGNVKISVPSGYLHGLTTGTNVAIDYLEGLSISQGFFKVTVLDNENFCLDNSSGITGAHTPDTGFFSVDPYLQSRIILLLNDASDITLDQCYIHGWPFPNRLLFGLVDSAKRTSVINSAFDRIEFWNNRDAITGYRCCGNISINTTTPSAIYFQSGEGKRYENNSIDGHGILIFSEVSGENTATTVRDFVIRRNHIRMNHKYRLGSEENPDLSNPKRGFYYTSRQPLECKRCYLGAIEGNWFDGSWADAVPRGAMVVMTLRTGLAKDMTNQMRDLDFRYNLFTGGGAGFDFTNDDAVHWLPPVLKRIRIAHNVMTGCDWWAYRSPYREGSSNTVGSVTGGGFLYWGRGGFEDFTVEHNTMEGCFGNGPWVYLIQSQRGAGWVWRNNIIGIHKGYGGGPGFRFDHNSGVVPAKTYGNWAGLIGDLTKRPDGTSDPHSGFYNNAILRGVWQNTGSDHGDVSMDATNQVTQSTCTSASWFGTESSTMFGNVCLNSPNGTTTSYRERVNAIWQNRDALNLAPLRTSAVLSGNQTASARTTDRSNFGADTIALDAARGVVRNVRVLDVTNSSVKLAYLAPDAAQCAVDYSTSPFPALGVTPTRVSDTGGDRLRSVQLSGLAGRPCTTTAFNVRRSSRPAVLSPQGDQQHHTFRARDRSS